MHYPHLSFDELESKMTAARLQKLDAALAQRTRHFSLVLEDLYDPHNISAIIRSSEVFGLQDVHIIEEVNPYRINRSILKGAFKWMSIFRYKQRGHCLKKLREQGYQIAVASTNTSRPFSEINLSRPTAFYMGAELAGNHPDTLAAADVHFMLPQYGITESLNVSVAAGVLLTRLDEWMEREGGRSRWALSPEQHSELRREWFERQVFGIEARPPLEDVSEPSSKD